jgi:hypothetical protein
MLEVTGGSSSTLVAANKQVDWPALYSSSSLATRNAEHAEQLLRQAAGGGRGAAGVGAPAHSSAAEAAAGGVKSNQAGHVVIGKKLQHHGVLGSDTQQQHQHRDVHLVPLSTPHTAPAAAPGAVAAAVAVPVAAAPAGAGTQRPAAAAGGGGGGAGGEEKHRGLGGRNIYPTSFWTQVGGPRDKEDGCMGHSCAYDGCMGVLSCRCQAGCLQHGCQHVCRCTFMG